MVGQTESVFRRIALVACALTAVGAAPAHAALETVLQDDGMLLHKPAGEVAGSMATIAALGVDRVRLTANWAALAPEPEAEQRPEFDAGDPAAYEQARWASLDRAVRLAALNGLKVVLDVGFWAPRWATTDTSPLRARTDVDPEAYAAFARAVAARYAGTFVPPDDPEGAPLPLVDQFTLWNEPNHPALLMPQWYADGEPASPDVYREMVRAAYPAIKALRPDATVLIGNTSSMGGKKGVGAVAPLTFLRELACVDEDLEPITGGPCDDFTPIPGDGWSHHPYAFNRRPDRRLGPNDLPIAALPKLARTIEALIYRGRLAPGVRDIHLTEFGYETAAIGTRPELSETQQARYLTWAEFLASRVPTVRSWPQFLLRDQPEAQTRVSDSTSRPYGEWFTGLQRADGSWKAAAISFRIGLFAQRATPETVRLWGRLRLGPRPRRVRVERRIGAGPWRVVATRATRDARSFVTPGDGAFVRYIAHRHAAQYRLVVRGYQPGPAVPVVAGASAPAAVTR